MHSIIETSKGCCVIDISGLYFLNKAEYENLDPWFIVQNYLKKKKSIYVNGKKETLSKLAVFLSENCNLKCIYCYANSGQNNKIVSIANVKLLLNYLAQRVNKIILDFHGGGEPLLQFDLIKEIYEYAKSLGKLYRTTLITNGVIEDCFEEKIEWIIKNVDILAISCDGFPAMQNINRPHMNNSETSSYVEKTFKELLKNNYNFTVRSTVTNNSVNELKHIMKYFNDCGISNVIFSPCYNYGRSTDESLLPIAKLYSENFMDAFDYAYKNGMNIRTNSFRLPGRNYCGAIPGFNIGLTTDGYISTCYEVINSKDITGKDFLIGKIEDNNINISLEKLDELNLFNNIENNCTSCKYKLVCRGGCPVKRKRNSINSLNNLCSITKILVPNILEYVHNNPNSINNILRSVEMYDV